MVNELKWGKATDDSRPVGIEHSRDNERPSPWLTPIEAALYLGVALGTLRNWTSARFIPFSKRGRVVRYHRDALDAWLNRGACPGRATFPNV